MKTALFIGSILMTMNHNDSFCDGSIFLPQIFKV